MSLFKYFPREHTRIYRCQILTNIIAEKNIKDLGLQLTPFEIQIFLSRPQNAVNLYGIIMPPSRLVLWGKL